MSLSCEAATFRGLRRGYAEGSSFKQTAIDRATQIVSSRGITLESVTVQMTVDYKDAAWVSPIVFTSSKLKAAITLAREES